MSKTNLIAEKVLFEVELKEAYKHYQLLNEVTLNRIMRDYFTRGFIVLTADKTYLGLFGKEPTFAQRVKQEKTNIENLGKLKDKVRRSGFGYVPALGGYKEKYIDTETGETRLVDTKLPESSLIIVARPEIGKDYKELLEFGMEIAKEYKQDSILYKPPNSIDKNAYFIKQDGSIDQTFKNVVENDLMQIYYTQLAKRQKVKRPFWRPGGKKRFSFVEVYIPLPPDGVEEARRRYNETFYRLQPYPDYLKEAYE